MKKRINGFWLVSLIMMAVAIIFILCALQAPTATFPMKNPMVFYIGYQIVMLGLYAAGFFRKKPKGEDPLKNARGWLRVIALGAAELSFVSLFFGIAAVVSLPVDGLLLFLIFGIGAVGLFIASLVIRNWKEIFAK